MLKRIFLTIIILLFSSSALASIQILEPISKTLKDEQTELLGAAQAGETIEIAINTTISEQEKWKKIEIENLPKDWNWKKEEQKNPNTILVKIMIPKKAKTDNYSFIIKAENENNKQEKINLIVSIEENLVTASIEQAKKKTTTGEKTNYVLKIVNNSIAEHSVKIDSTLPNNWLKPTEVLVPKKSTQTQKLEITPLVSGIKPFKIVLLSKLNNKKIELNAEIEALPVLEKKYSIAFSGFPFFTPSLLPYYLINSFLSLAFANK